VDSGDATWRTSSHCRCASARCRQLQHDLSIDSCTEFRISVGVRSLVGGGSCRQGTNRLRPRREAPRK
jgi:hypothetical protein